MEFILPLPKQLDQNGVLLKQWTTFYQRFRCHQSSVSITTPAPDTHSILLFASKHNLDSVREALEVYNLDSVKLGRVLEVVERACLPNFLLLFERFRYFTLEQESSETLTDFVNTMRKQIDLCEFGDTKSSIMASTMANGASASAECFKQTAQNIDSQFLEHSEAEYSNHSDMSMPHDDNVTAVSSNSVTAVPETNAADVPSKLRTVKKKTKVKKTAKSTSKGNVYIVPNKSSFKEEMDSSDLIVQTIMSAGAKKRAVNVMKKSVLRPQTQPKPKTFLCFKCDNEYASRKSFRRHVASKHVDCGDYFCKHCKKTFHNRTECITHCMGHNTSPVSGPRAVELKGGNSEYICWYCDETLPNLDDYKKHCLLHSAVRVFYCDLCQRKNHTLVRMIGHLKGHLSPRYRCEVCANCFGRAELLAAHMLTHEAHPVHQCQICDKKFVSADRLQGHLRTHSGEKRFTCELCGKSFCQKMSLDYHKRVHAGEKPYECDVCGKRTASFGYLRKHKQMHSDKRPYVCEVCGKDFRFISNLTRHRNGHSGKRAFGCDICGRTFIYREGLRDHIKANRCPGRKQDGIIKRAARSPRSKIHHVPNTSVSSGQAVASYAPMLHPHETLLSELPHWQYMLRNNEPDGTDGVLLVPPYY